MRTETNRPISDLEKKILIKNNETQKSSHDKSIHKTLQNPSVEVINTTRGKAYSRMSFIHLMRQKF